MQAMQAVRVTAKAADADALAPSLALVDAPVPAAGQALVRVGAAGVNPSDVKAALGLMPQAVFPRTPGRDYAGTVVAGPAEWLGRDVWGSGGDIGITRDGSHGGWLLLPVQALREKPARLTMEEAGSVGVPFVTAVEGYRRSRMQQDGLAAVGQQDSLAAVGQQDSLAAVGQQDGLAAVGPQAGQVVAVLGANGKVGQAAVQLAAQAGATVIAVHRLDGPHIGHACTQVHTINGKTDDVAARIREISSGHGADIVFNTVGSPYFEAANKALAKRGTMVLIATVERPVPFDIFTFYRAMHTYVGIDTLALDAVEAAERIASLHAGMEAGTLRPFAVAPSGVYPLADALTVYRRVLAGADERCVLRP